jgi:hypothetical protein
MIKDGAKMRCLESIYNIFKQPLFEKGKTYEVLHYDKKYEEVTLNHVLYGNEYQSFPKSWVKRNFEFIEE